MKDPAVKTFRTKAEPSSLMPRDKELVRTSCIVYRAYSVSNLHMLIWSGFSPFSSVSCEFSWSEYAKCRFFVKDRECFALSEAQRQQIEW
nr:hypothetical protein [Brevibacillus sp. Leaf182]